MAKIAAAPVLLAVNAPPPQVKPGKAARPICNQKVSGTGQTLPDAFAMLSQILSRGL